MQPEHHLFAEDDDAAKDIVIGVQRCSDVPRHIQFKNAKEIGLNELVRQLTARQLH